MSREPVEDSGPAAEPASHPDPASDRTPGATAEGAAGWDTAGFGARFLAILVDWVLCLMLAGLVADPPATGWWVYALLIPEYAIFMGRFGQTPGMWLAKIRCASVADAGPIGMARALARTVLMCLVIPVLIMDSYGRGLHDRAVGSIMLSAPRPRP